MVTIVGKILPECWASPFVNEEKELLRRFNAGQSQALHCIYERYKIALSRVGRALLNDPAGSEDVLHDVFVQFGRFRLRGSLKGYLAICVANRARNVNQQARPMDPARLREARISHQEENHPVQVAQRSELLETLISSLQQLPAEQRQVIALHVLGDLRFREIAKMSNVSIHTIQSRYRYGLQKLQARLNGELER